MMASLGSLRECVSCKEVSADTTYFLQCLHALCEQCLTDAARLHDNKRKRPECCECKETFELDGLTPVPSDNDTNVGCAECGFPSVYFCRTCQEHLCNIHGEGHPSLKKTKGHVVNLSDDLFVCYNHPNVIAASYCTHCQQHACTECIVTNHNQPPHGNISVQNASTRIIEVVRYDVLQLLESIPNLDQHIKRRQDSSEKITDEIKTYKVKLEELVKRQKAEAIEIEHIKKTKELLDTTRTRVNSLAVAVEAFPRPSLLPLKDMIARRVEDLQTSINAIPVLPSPPRSTAFRCVCPEYVIVSRHGKLLTCKNHNESFGYGIISDGCSSGVRSWRFKINKISTANYNILIGVWTHYEVPSRNPDSDENNAWLLQFTNTTTIAHRGAVPTDLDIVYQIQTSDHLVLTVYCDERCFMIRNTTQGWKCLVNQLPAPRPGYYPQVILCNQHDSISIDS